MSSKQITVYHEKFGTTEHVEPLLVFDDYAFIEDSHGVQLLQKSGFTERAGSYEPMIAWPKPAIERLLDFLLERAASSAPSTEIEEPVSEPESGMPSLQAGDSQAAEHLKQATAKSQPKSAGRKAPAAPDARPEASGAESKSENPEE